MIATFLDKVRDSARTFAGRYRTGRETTPRKGPENRLAPLRLTLAAGLVAGLLLSPNLWVSTRPYPLTPLWDAIPPLPYPADYALFGFLVALVAGVGVARGRTMGWLAAGALALAAFFVLEDESRSQPWFYQYSFMLAAFCLYGWGRIGASDTLNTCRLIVIATYFWSGLQKANTSFFEITYPWLVEPLTSRLPDWAGSALLSGAYAVPVVEAAIGLGLLTRRFRKPAVVGALLMHAFIMLCVGPLGSAYNTVVWPWNFAMSAFVVILFWGAPDEPSPSTILDPGRNLSPGSVLRAAVLVLFAFMPLFNVSSLAGLTVKADIPDSDLERISTGMKAELTMDAFPNQTLTGTITSLPDLVVGSQGQAPDRSTRVDVSWPGPGAEMGMLARVQVTLLIKRDVLMVPNGAVRVVGKRKFVEYMDNDIKRSRNVETGISTESDTEVISGLQEGMVILAGQS